MSEDDKTPIVPDETPGDLDNPQDYTDVTKDGTADGFWFF